MAPGSSGGARAAPSSRQPIGREQKGAGLSPEGRGFPERGRGLSEGGGAYLEEAAQGQWLQGGVAAAGARQGREHPGVAPPQGLPQGRAQLLQHLPHLGAEPVLATPTPSSTPTHQAPPTRGGASPPPLPLGPLRPRLPRRGGRGPAGAAGRDWPAGEWPRPAGGPAGAPGRGPAGTAAPRPRTAPPPGGRAERPPAPTPGGCGGETGRWNPRPIRNGEMEEPANQKRATRAPNQSEKGS